MPRWKELKRFCDRDGWELYKDTDHYFYRKTDDNGNIRLTKVSKGSGEIHSHMWREILKKQLQVTQEYFNSKIQLKLELCSLIWFVATPIACYGVVDYAMKNIF